jgi:hypothetical protein
MDEPVLSGSAGATPPAAEAAVRRILCIPQGAARPTEAETSRIFTVSMAMTGVRCVFTYGIVPVMTPALGAVAAPWIGIPLSLLALVFDVRGIRSFWRAYHPQRWLMTVLYLVVMGFVTYLLVRDLMHLIH